MTEYKKKIALWISLAVAASLVMVTDPLTGLIAGYFTSDAAMGSIIRFPLVYIFWIAGILSIHSFYKKTPLIHFPNRDKPETRHILIGLLLLAIATALTGIGWEGLKMYKEFTGAVRYSGIGLGIAYFFAQHIYYFLEAILMTMIVAFTQEAGEVLFKSPRIPYGGIALAVLWGLNHIAWHGLADGLQTTFHALLYGLAFLAMRKNLKWAFGLVFLMFVL
jgi:MFS family permease